MLCLLYARQISTDPLVDVAGGISVSKVYVVEGGESGDIVHCGTVGSYSYVVVLVMVSWDF